MSTLKVTNIESPSGGGISAKINDIGGGQLSNRNLIINGAMQVAQRGTTGTSQNGNNNFVVDRFKVNIAGSSTVTHSQESAGAPSGFSRWLKLTPTVAEASLASTSYGTLSNLIEGYDFAHVNYGTADAQNVTVSFKFKTNKAGTYCIVHRNIAADRNYLHEFTPVADGSWQTITYTVPGDTTGTWSTTNSIGWRFELCIGNGTAYQSSTTGSWFSGQYFHSTPNQVNFLDSTSNELGITGVQVEVGDTATSFEHRSYGDELQRCQRYFLNISAATAYTYQSGSGSYTRGNLIAEFPVTMRATPDIAFTGNGYWMPAGSSVTPTGDRNGGISGSPISYVGGPQGISRCQFSRTLVSSSVLERGVTYRNHGGDNNICAQASAEL